MQKTQYAYLICFIIVVGVSINGRAQPALDELYNLYETHRFEELKSRLSQFEGESSNNLEIHFFKTLFNNDGEESKNTYERIFKNGKPDIKRLAAEKLRQYYYAKGYYRTASEYQKYLVENAESHHDEPADERENKQDTSTRYFIQVGAFSLEDNAERLIQMLSTQNIDAEKAARTIEGDQFYLVWVPGGDDFEETLDLANDLKSKYDLKYRIIKK